MGMASLRCESVEIADAPVRASLGAATAAAVAATAAAAAERVPGTPPAASDWTLTTPSMLSAAAASRCKPACFTGLKGAMHAGTALALI